MKPMRRFLVAFLAVSVWLSVACSNSESATPKTKTATRTLGGYTIELDQLVRQNDPSLPSSVPPVK